MKVKKSDLTVTTHSDQETKDLGRMLAEEIRGCEPHSATVISLEGDLGAGKTTFTKGFAEGLGIDEIIQSPTFVILKIYKFNFPSLRRRGSGRLIHIDAYRIEGRDLISLGWEAFIKNPHNIILVEWGDRIKKILPPGTLRAIFKHKNKDTRTLSFRS